MWDTVVVGPALGHEHGGEQREGDQADAGHHGLAPSTLGHRAVPAAGHRRTRGFGTGRPGLDGAVAGARVEIAAGAPAEHGLGEQDLQSAVEMAELFGGVPAEPALRQVLLHIGEQRAAPANGDVEETVVEAAFLRRGEFPVGAHQADPELFTGLVEGGRRGSEVDAQQTGGYVYGFGFDLGVPEEALRGSGKSLESTFCELPSFRGPRSCGAESPAAGGFAQFRYGHGNDLVGGPCADRLPYGHQELRTQGAADRAPGQPAEYPLEGGAGDQLRGRGGGGEADDRVVTGGAPVPGEQQGDGMMPGRGGSGELGDEIAVGFRRGRTGARRVRRAWGVGGLH
ncbi:hypothetical protein ABZ357_29115 [Streptomyces sp. NPDC005917]|uniref:hypothetical protein n=1 Tax=unclassified Streptomyces TaxID=2593676 RepID=UPI0033EE9C28